MILVTIKSLSVERMQAMSYHEMDLKEERISHLNIFVKKLKAYAQTIKEDILSETEILYEMKTL